MEHSEARKTKIEVKNLTKKFGDLLVLDEISFNVAEGEFSFGQAAFRRLQEP